MPNQRTETVLCPQCNKESSFVVWDTIQATINKWTDKRAANLDLFKFKCPHCGHETLVNYSFLYHHPKLKFMIRYAATPEEKQISIDEVHGTIAPMIRLGYRYRVVDTLDDYLEKLAIFLGCLDDHTIELLKVHISAILSVEMPDFHVDECRLLNKDGKYDIDNLCFQLYDAKNDKSLTVDFRDTKKIYDTLYSDFADDIKKNYKGECLINHQWAYQYLQRKAAATVM